MFILLLSWNAEGLCRSMAVPLFKPDDGPVNVYSGTDIKRWLCLPPLDNVAMYKYTKFIKMYHAFQDL